MALTVTGASTLCTLLSSTNISLARRHRAFTSPSRRYSHRLRRSICSSKQLFPPLVSDDAAMFVVNAGSIDSIGKEVVEAGIWAAAPASVACFAEIIEWTTFLSCSFIVSRLAGMVLKVRSLHRYCTV